MSVHTVPLPDRPALHQCEHRMRGSKGWRKRGYLNIQVGQWSKPCTNHATGTVKNRWVCAVHGGPKT